MKKRTATPALLAAGLAVLSTFVTTPPGVQAYPKPAIVSPSWNFEFTHGEPRSVPVTDVAGKTRWFWYLPYKVVNNTGEDRLFAPEITIYGDNGQIITAGENVPAGVFRVIKEQLGNDLLQNPVTLTSDRLLQGEDYAVESVAIWPDFSSDVDAFTIFIGGLSGETQSVKDPVTGEETLVRRTRMLEYRAPGNPPTPRNATIIPGVERDVMR